MRETDHPATLVRDDDARRRIAEHDPAHRLAIDAHPVTLKFLLGEFENRQSQLRPIRFNGNAFASELGALFRHPSRYRKTPQRNLHRDRATHFLVAVLREERQTARIRVDIDAANEISGGVGRHHDELAILRLEISLGRLEKPSADALSLKFWGDAK